MFVEEEIAMSSTPSTHIAFIGGGNMASAIIGGLMAQGMTATQITVVEPFEAARTALHNKFGITALTEASPALAAADLVVWATKPQTFKDAASPVAGHTRQALHLSVAAGITTDSIAQWLDTGRIVRAMPNTPALVGKGMTGLFARAEVSDADQALIERVIGTTGQLVWVDAEEKLDAVTALSGSGPAYVFLFLEAMTQAGVDMGLTAAQAYQLAIATFQGASELAARSDEPASVLRERVTSKGGTTYAAITHMQQTALPEHFMAAMRKAETRAKELAAEFGAP